MHPIPCVADACRVAEESEMWAELSAMLEASARGPEGHLHSASSSGEWPVHRIVRHFERLAANPNRWVGPELGSGVHVRLKDGRVGEIAALTFNGENEPTAEVTFADHAPETINVYQDVVSSATSAESLRELSSVPGQVLTQRKQIESWVRTSMDIADEHVAAVVDSIVTVAGQAGLTAIMDQLQNIGAGHPWDPPEGTYNEGYELKVDTLTDELEGYGGLKEGLPDDDMRKHVLTKLRTALLQLGKLPSVSRVMEWVHAAAHPQACTSDGTDGNSPRDVARSSSVYELRMWGIEMGTFCGRYEVDAHAVHKSETCMVIFATDLKASDKAQRRVALKLMVS